MKARTRCRSLSHGLDSGPKDQAKSKPHSQGEPLGPPDLRGWNKGTGSFSVVYFGRGTLPTKKESAKGHLAGGPRPY